MTDNDEDLVEPWDRISLQVHERTFLTIESDEWEELADERKSHSDEHRNNGLVSGGIFRSCSEEIHQECCRCSQSQARFVKSEQGSKLIAGAVHTYVELQRWVPTCRVAISAKIQSS